MRVMEISSVMCAALGLGLGSWARADVVAADDAANYVGIGWVNGSDAGTGTPGFTSPWLITYSSDAYAGLSATNPVSWELQANAISQTEYTFAYASRSFPALVPNQAVTIDMNADDIDANGYAGVNFIDANDEDEFQVFVQPAVATQDGYSSEDYLVDIGSFTIDTGLAADGQNVQVILQLIDNTAGVNTYSASLQQGSTVVPIVTPDNSPLSYSSSSSIDSVTMADFGSATPFYLNNLVVVPLPRTVLASAPLLAILALIRFRTHREAKL